MQKEEPFRGEEKFRASIHKKKMRPWYDICILSLKSMLFAFSENHNGSSILDFRKYHNPKDARFINFESHITLC